jgi:hypothetical protein
VIRDGGMNGRTRGAPLHQTTISDSTRIMEDLSANIRIIRGVDFLSEMQTCVGRDESAWGVLLPFRRHS